MTGFVVGSGVVEIVARTEKLRSGYEQARREAEAGALKIGQSLDKGVSAGAVRAASAVNKMGRDIDDAADRAGRAIDEGITSRLNRIAGVAQSAFGALAGGALGAFSVAAITRIGRELVQVASDAEETENKFRVSFGAMSESVRAWSNEAAERMGRSGLAFRDAASSVALVTTALGGTSEQIEEMSTKLTERAVDIGSIFNVDDADAMRAIVSALTGEAEGVKRFGVVLSQARLEAQLLANGIDGGADSASEAEKAFARYQIIMRDTSVAQGDAERTAGGFANKSKALQAAITELKIELGQELLPIAIQIVSGVTDMVKAFNDLDPAARNMAAAAVAAAALLVPVGVAVAGILATLRAIPGAAAAAGAATAAAGFGGGAAAAGRLRSAGAAGVAIAGGALIAGDINNRLTQQDIRKNPGKYTTENLEAERDRFLSEYGGLFKGQEAPRRGVRDVRRNGREQFEGLNAIEAELKRRYREDNLAFEAKQQLERAAAAAALEPVEGSGGRAKGGSGGGKGDAEREAKRAAREAERLAEERARERARILANTNGLLGDIDRELVGASRDQVLAARNVALSMADQMALEKELLGFRIAARDAAAAAMRADIDAQEAVIDKSSLSAEEKQLQRDLIAQARKKLDAITAENAQTTASEQQALNMEWRARFDQRQQEILNQQLDAQIEALQIQLDGETDRKEARAIQTQILEIERKRADALADAAHAADLLAGYSQAEADARRAAALQNNEARQAAGQERVNRATESPIEAYLRQMREGLDGGTDRALVGVLDDLKKGLFDVITGAESAEDALKKMVRNFLLELVQLELNKAFLALFGGAGVSVGRSGGGILQSIGSAIGGIFGGGFGAGFGQGSSVALAKEIGNAASAGDLSGAAGLKSMAVAGAESGARVVNVYADGYITEQVLRGMIADAMLQTGSATQASTISTIQRRAGKAFA